MRGVTEQRYAAAAPHRHRVKIVEIVTNDGLRRGLNNDRRNRLVEITIEFQERRPHVTLIDPPGTAIRSGIPIAYDPGRRISLGETSRNMGREDLERQAQAGSNQLTQGVGTRRWSSSNQCWTTMIGGWSDWPPDARLIIRNRCPSGEISNEWN